MSVRLYSNITIASLPAQHWRVSGVVRRRLDSRVAEGGLEDQDEGEDDAVEDEGVRM